MIHVDETTPHLHCDFGAVDQGGTRSAKDDSTAKMRRTQDSSLKAMQEGAACAKFASLEPEKAQFNGLDQKFTKR